MAEPAGRPFEVEFLEKLQRLLDAGEFTSTYKFAILIGLTELVFEALPSHSMDFTTRNLAARVARLYWPHVEKIEPRHGPGLHLPRQNRGRPAEIITRTNAVRESLVRYRTEPPTLDLLRMHSPEVYEDYLDEIEWKLIEMPLPRLQRLPSGVDEFLYSISWDLADVEPNRRIQPAVRKHQKARREWSRHHSDEPPPVLGGFDSRIRLKDGVRDVLSRFHWLIREVVEPRWVRMVEQLNPEICDCPDLRERLFGAQRIPLERVRPFVKDAQKGRCFYCEERMTSVVVDHFIPWSKYHVDYLENLVGAHARCNGSKSAHLPALVHLARWCSRLEPGGRESFVFDEAAGALGWRRRPDACLAIANQVYDQHPDHAPLWLQVGAFQREWSHIEVVSIVKKAQDWF